MYRDCILSRVIFAHGYAISKKYIEDFYVMPAIFIQLVLPRRE